jgi:hypothetical protein
MSPYRRTKPAPAVRDVRKRRQEGSRRLPRPTWGSAVREVFPETPRAAVLLAFYAYPAEHWIHLPHHQPDRVHLRHRQASPASHQGPRSRAAGVAMAFKLIERPDESEVVISKSRDTPIPRS